MRACVKKKIAKTKLWGKTQQDATTQGSLRKKFFIQAKYKMHTVQKLMYNIMQICQCKREVKFESNMFFKAK